MNQVGVTGRTDLGPEYVENIFSGSLKKKLSPEKLTQYKAVQFFITLILERQDL